MIELKPCPFCGGEAKHYTNTNFGEIVACKKCGSKTDYFASKGAATKAWNRRADAPTDEYKFCPNCGADMRGE